MSTVVEEAVPFRVGEWLPSDQSVLEKWLGALIEKEKQKPIPLDSVIVEFKKLIEDDPEVYMLFTKMFQQIPNRPPYNKTPTDKPQVKDYQHMLRLINRVMTTAPLFNKTGLVGFSINAILDWPMGTPAGTAAFLNNKVNKQLKKILDKWGTYLKSEESACVLNSEPNHWFSEPALDALAKKDPFYGQGDDPKDPRENFIYNFKCDLAKTHWGYKSWDDFFTREFNEGRRPVASPDDPGVITNACESAPYRIAYGVQKRETFWIKAQPYSLDHMLAGRHVDKFLGGTVYQAFLSAKSYHRWNCPVDGEIVQTCIIEGSYYAEALSEGFDRAGPNDSQGYITEVATRALIFIKADNDDIGLMCFKPVGMAEVSSCDIQVEKGHPVKKGDSLGTFRFGGSTHCLFFGPQVKLAFDLHGQTPGLNSSNIPVNAKLATVVKPD
ncbi:MAG: phosphatidylserine decarboxylase family protein [Candidatus Scalindua sp.]|jgi:phosphatidylserine decarboxylase|nr:phosphatidylserine decarboxylase family protein [Candidatus Scalindua sp.]MBT5304081.1 phosphatidylserine decarboxylase family protein [Candidatus Scalindua sp.]MBT6225085.1 phosphatidylserine decarboxylase family protein [Candidatus Scalindua sp.]MBT6564891.1 phosphatidylserine decarboxylase family protein [Candidatus Scalindua sp.]MBT7212985.1 phosphatidylserine decarboxylase family protein [Candidatus Scalindua sp.]